MVALYTVWCNFVKQHKAHRLSPAMATGLSDKLWPVEDIANLVEAAAPVATNAARTKARGSDFKVMHYHRQRSVARLAGHRGRRDCLMHGNRQGSTLLGD